MRNFEVGLAPIAAGSFNPSDPLVGTSIDEMKRRYEGQRDREFKSHICAEYPREERIKDV
jgi:hypothetical protein